MLKKEDLEKWVVVVYNKEELKEVCDLLKVENTINLKNFPIIIYQDLRETIGFSEISQENLEKLQIEKLETKTLWNFQNIANGLATKMNK